MPATWRVALRPGVRRALPDDALGRLQERIEQVKASLRAKVAHPFHIVKNLFKRRKTRCRGWPRTGRGKPGTVILRFLTSETDLVCFFCLGAGIVAQNWEFRLLGREDAKLGLSSF